MVLLNSIGKVPVLSIVCIRSKESILPRYRIKMWARGPHDRCWAEKDVVGVETDVSSSETPGDVTFDQVESYLVVPTKYLIGTGPTKKLSFYVRIDKNA